VAGGMKISEPAADLPLAVALASALTNVAVPSDVAIFGELALTGSVRRVPHAGARVREAERMGMTRVIGAHETARRDDSSAVHSVESLAGALEALRLSAR
jgi:DNA repair protein RadA/Sms